MAYAKTPQPAQTRKRVKRNAAGARRKSAQRRAMRK